MKDGRAFCPVDWWHGGDFSTRWVDGPRTITETVYPGRGEIVRSEECDVVSEHPYNMLRLKWPKETR